FVLPAYFNPWASAPYDHLRALDEPFSLDAGGYAVYQRAGADHERLGRGFGVTFDDAMPDWQRALKLRGWGRTYWRRALNRRAPRAAPPSDPGAGGVLSPPASACSPRSAHVGRSHRRRPPA